MNTKDLFEFIEANNVTSDTVVIALINTKGGEKLYHATIDFYSKNGEPAIKDGIVGMRLQAMADDQFLPITNVLGSDLNVKDLIEIRLAEA